MFGLKETTADVDAHRLETADTESIALSPKKYESKTEEVADKLADV